MTDDEQEEHKVIETIKDLVTYTIYAIAVYRILDDLSDGALTLRIQYGWAHVKYRFEQEKLVKKETGAVIFQAMEAIENAE